MTVLRDYAAALSQPTLTGSVIRYDEVIAPDGTLRSSWKGLADLAVRLTPGDLSRLDDEIRQFLNNDGVTYARPGQESGTWQLDPVPLVISSAEWAPLEVGLAQRAELLNAILIDLYGEQNLLREGVLPPEVIFGHSGFVRTMARTSAADPRPLVIAAADLGRTQDGTWTVLSDRAQAPSGIGYALENRRVISQVLPELYREAGLHRVRPFLDAFRSALIQTADVDVIDPRVVVLSPGTHSETSYDQANVAASLGFPLVRGSDLLVREGRVYLRGYAGAIDQVDVILRRVDASWSDPLELRADSRLGVPGLSEAVRRGTVRIVNGLGAGVLENPGLLPYLPAASEALLGESLRLPSAQTWWCGDAEARDHVLANLDQLAVRAIDKPGVDLVSEYADGALLGQKIIAEPHRFVGQERLMMSQAPSFSGGSLEPRALTLRTFTLRSGSAYRPMVGGLASTQDPTQLRGTSKDVWVLKANPEEADAERAEVLTLASVQARPAVVPRALDDLYWFGRYTARAEDTLRMLLAAHSLNEDFRSRPYSPGGRASRVMLEALSNLAGAPAEDGEVDRHLRAILLDAGQSGSVAQSVAALRDCAQSVRDQLSLDVWKTFGAFDRASWELVRHNHSYQVSESAGRMLNATLALHGVTSNMVRDEGWRMIRIGGWLERAMQVAQLLRLVIVRNGLDVDRMVLNQALLAADSAVTHRRRYRGYVRPRTVLDLLLFDEENPRSIEFALTELHRHLGALKASTGSTRPERLLDELVEECRTADLTSMVALDGETRPHLVKHLDQLSRQLVQLGDSIAGVHFEPGPRMRPLGLTELPVKFRVWHRTTYTYDEPVTDSLGVGHLTPRALPWQNVASPEVTIEPMPADLTHQTDYYGNSTTYFQVTQPHTELRVTAEAEVEVLVPFYDAAALVAPWEDADPARRRDVPGAWQAIDFVLESSQIAHTNQAREYGAVSLVPGRPIGEAVTDLMHRIHADFTYEIGATSVTSTLDEVFTKKAGVCQDFAHLTIACLRTHGLAARYVSGYLATEPPPGHERIVGADASHAWVAVWVPGTENWLAVDPTNDQWVNDRYITTAWGRDYGDVPPLKGVIFSDATTSTLTVEVDVAPLT